MAVWRCTRRTSSVSGSARRNADIFSLSCSHNCCSDSRDCSLFARVEVVVVIMVVPFCWLLSIISGVGRVRGKCCLFLCMYAHVFITPPFSPTLQPRHHQPTQLRSQNFLSAGLQSARRLSRYRKVYLSIRLVGYLIQLLGCGE